MRIVVYPHVLEIGGSQLNAVELAGAMARRGHDVLVFGTPGPLVDTVRRLGLDYVASPPPGRRPSSRVAAALTAACRDFRADIVHAYEWPPALEAWIGPRRRLGIPAVATVMSMGVAPFIPRAMPLVVGTRMIQEQAQPARRAPVVLIEPPVDTVWNAPGVDSSGFADRFGLDPVRDRHIVVVSRLARELKLEGLLTAVDVVGRLAADRPVRLVVVGDGPARDDLQASADAVNRRAGRAVVVLTGELPDPRPAYALGDVVLGMGGSALRALAFAKPLVVQGEAGFWAPLTPSTAAVFETQGWYGRGDGDRSGADLHRSLTVLLGDPSLRATLGRFGRDLVVRRFSLDRAADVQAAVYTGCLAGPAPVDRPGDLQAAGRFATHVARRKWQRLVGRSSRDDFNADPKVSVHPTGTLSGGLADLDQPDSRVPTRSQPWPAVATAQGVASHTGPSELPAPA